MDPTSEPNGDGERSFISEPGHTQPGWLPATPGNPKHLDRLRIWPSLLTVVISFFTFVIASVILTHVAILLVLGELDNSRPLSELLTQTATSRIGFVVMFVLPQLALVIPCLVAALLSPLNTRRRLGLVRGHWPWWAWAGAAAAAPFVGMISTIFVGMFLEESQALKEIQQIFQVHGRSGFLMPLAIMIGGTPAICEELLFRGYLQTRLTRTMPPWIGIFIASVLFATFHMDFVHVLAVMPIGFFLGWVSWHSGSLYPAMLAHFVNNVLSVVIAAVGSDENASSIDLPTLTLSLSILTIGMLGLAAMALVTVTTYQTNRQHPATTSIRPKE